MSLQHHDNGKQGEFSLLDEQGKKIAKLTYFMKHPIPLMLITRLLMILFEDKVWRTNSIKPPIHFIQAKKLTGTQLVAISQEKMGTNPISSITKLNLINKLVIFKDIFPTSCYP